MGYLDSTKITEFNGEFFEITKDTDKVIFTSKLNIIDCRGEYNDLTYLSFMADLLTENQYPDVLVSGLGLGVIPQWLASEKSSRVDVIELNQELIDAISGMGYLNANVNIIQSDIYQYTTEKQYDLIYLDHWFFPDKDYTNQRTQLINTFSGNKKTNGSVIFPIMKEIF